MIFNLLKIYTFYLKNYIIIILNKIGVNKYYYEENSYYNICFIYNGVF